MTSPASTLRDLAAKATDGHRTDENVVAMVRLKEALLRYGQHDRSCSYIGQPVLGVCTCGYLAVLAEDKP